MSDRMLNNDLTESDEVDFDVVQKNAEIKFKSQMNKKLKKLQRSLSKKSNKLKIKIMKMAKTKPTNKRACKHTKTKISKKGKNTI